MGRYTSIRIIFLSLLFGLLSCDQSKLDFNKFNGQFDLPEQDFSYPLANVRISLDSLFKFDNKIIKTDNLGNYYFSYKVDTLVYYGMSDVFSLPLQGSSSLNLPIATILTTGQVLVPTPSLSEYDRILEDSFYISLSTSIANQKFKFFNLSQGVLHTTINNPSFGNILVQMQIPIQSNGVQDYITRELTVFPLTSNTIDWDISNQDIDLSGDPSSPANKIKIKYKFIYLNAPVAISTGALSIAFQPQNIRIANIQGYLGEVRLNVNPMTLFSTDAFTTFRNFNVDFQQANIKLSTTNSFGLPLIYRANMNAFNTLANTSENILFSDIISASPAMGQSITNINTHDIKNLFHILPNTINASVETDLNYLGDLGNYNQFVTSSSKLLVAAEVTAPLHFYQLTGLGHIDTIPASLSWAALKDSVIQEAYLLIKSVNTMPMGARLKIRLQTLNHVQIDSIDVNNFVTAAQYDNQGHLSDTGVSNVKAIALKPQTAPRIPEIERIIIQTDLVTNGETVLSNVGELKLNLGCRIVFKYRVK